MLEHVDVGSQSVDGYAQSAGPEAIKTLRELAEPLEGLRVLHVSATPYGGGVAELLRSEIPLLRDLGVIADWKLISGDAAFFTVTKTIHNALQGAPDALTPADEQRYLSQSERNAADAAKSMGPGGQTGTTESSVTGITPRKPALRESHSRTRNQPTAQRSTAPTTSRPRGQKRRRNRR